MNDSDLEADDDNEESFLEIFSNAFIPLFEDRKRQAKVLGFQRHLHFVQWITIIGFAILTLAIPIYFTSSAIHNMALFWKIILYIGSLLIVLSVATGVYSSFRYHKVSEAEVTTGYLAALDIEKVKNELTADSGPIDKIFGIMKDQAVNDILSRVRKTADSEIAELEKKYRLFYYLQFPLFVLGVALTVTSLLVRLFQVLFGSGVS